MVAATLLDLKAARLLPQGEVEDAEDLALLEARDLLFARLLQYRAFKEVAASLERLLDAPAPHAARRRPRAALRDAAPGIGVGGHARRLARLAAHALQPKPDAPLVSTAHLHNPR